MQSVNKKCVHPDQNDGDESNIEAESKPHENADQIQSGAKSHAVHSANLDCGDHGTAFRY